MERSPLDYPFLDYKGVMEVLGPFCKKDKAYALMKSLLEETDENGNPLIDKSKIPSLGHVIVPTDIFCKRFNIKRPKRKFLERK